MSDVGVAPRPPGGTSQISYPLQKAISNQCEPSDGLSLEDLFKSRVDD